MPSKPAPTGGRFFKVVGAGNDFILIDERTGRLRGNPAKLARVWCDRRRGIGADGLLLVGSSKQAEARMRIFNADGSEAEMCGNGLRCVAWYLQSHPATKQSRFKIKTGAGLMRAQVVGKERVRIFLQPPKGIRLNLAVPVGGKRHAVHAVNTGVPHAILPVPRLDRVEVSALGPAIRHHKVFRPVGTNVDWVQVRSPHSISIRTYERGVEAETLACGTGAVASVIIGAELGRLKSPVQVSTAGGEKLTVGFKGSPAPYSEVYLEGPARVIFEGVIV